MWIEIIDKKKGIARLVQTAQIVQVSEDYYGCDILLKNGKKIATREEYEHFKKRLKESDNETDK